MSDSSLKPEDTFTYELTALDGAPLPAQATDGKVSFVLKGSETKSFDIVYEHPGLYQYELKQIVPEKKEGYTYDETVWTARVYVTNATNGGLIADVLLPLNTQGQKANEDTPVHRFRNTYTAEVEKSGKPGTPADGKKDPKAASKSHTSEATGAGNWASLMLVGLAGLVVFVVISRREKQKGNADEK
ncbi:Spy0128 family protein [uncultured Faecalibaculum sp.]|uniref:Spy0128 family protein n=1 Tax=uncultured Faecalibaculum sp. TaxID=1729681 RepID=UPI002612F1E3|nr:FctA domain-containing protein [uncultured Faecalibaculum sp.]